MLKNLSPFCLLREKHLIMASRKKHVKIEYEGNANEANGESSGMKIKLIIEILCHDFLNQMQNRKNLSQKIGKLFWIISER